MNNIIEKSRKEIGERASKKQRLASNPLTSVWVQASAGTGKTKVLSDRVLRLLLRGVSPERILCLTYTKAAAVEMSSRIAGRLSRWSILEDTKLEKELVKLLGFVPENIEDTKAMARKLFAVLLDTPGGLKIQTIHSFCQEILKRFPIEAKISPYFEIMDDRASREALDDIRTKLINNIEQNPNSITAKSLIYLTQNVSEYSFPKIMSSITDNRNKISKLLDEYKNIDDLIKDLANNLGVSPSDTEDSLIEAFFYELDKETIKKIMQAWFESSSSDIANGEHLARILSSNNIEKHYKEYKDLFFQKGKNEPKNPSRGKAAVVFYPDLPIVFAREQERIMELENKKSSLSVFASTKAVVYLANELIGGYKKYKKQHSKMDYEDLIVITKDLLENKDVADWVLFKLDGGIDHILIDEAQDTSPIQWDIIKSITQDFFSGKSAREEIRTVFAVGDKKQSIYSFQGADPREFEISRKHFENKSKDFEDVRLEVSFRSTPTVLDFVNCVFEDTKARVGVASNDENIIHIPFREGDAGRVELWPIVKADEASEEHGFLLPVERRSKESASSKLAKTLAQNIKDLVVRREILESKNRPIKYGDFLVLVQSRNSFIEEFVRECKNINVKVAGIDKIKLLEQIAIQDLIAIGKFLLLPTDDLTLATILKSPIFGLDDDDLFKLCYNRGGVSLWQRLLSNENYVKISEELKELLNRTDFIRPFELYSYLLTKLQGRKKFIERMGEEVIDGLDEFMNLTLRFEQEHIPNLQGFIDWISKDEIEIKREQEQGDADVVRIMTVHGSKGLQAPIVILPDTVKIKNAKKEAEMLWDELFYYPLGSSSYNQKCLEINNKNYEASMEEYRRLLYVALTRAEDRLYICGYKNKGDAHEDSWYSLLERKSSEIAIKTEDKKYLLNSEQKLEPEKEKEQKTIAFDLPDFDWIYKNAKIENPLSKPYMPSVGEEDSDIALMSPIDEFGDNRYRRGLIIHKLLQFLPNIDKNNRAGAIDEFINKNAPDINGKNKIKTEILRLFEDNRFSLLFGLNSKDEVPVVGEVDGKIVSAQIDRLVVLKDKVMVVDFKTNRPAAKDIKDVPKQYLNQLRFYKRLLSNIYKDKKIETYILWTDIAEIMSIE